MIPNQVFEQLASGAFDKAQVIIVTKMLMVTAENVRSQIRAEVAEEMRQMRGDYGRLIIEAVEATEAKIFARLEQERLAQEEKKRERREAAAVRKRERETAKAAQVSAMDRGGSQTGLFDDVPLDVQGVQGGTQEGAAMRGRLAASPDDDQPSLHSLSGFQPSTPLLTKEVAAKIEDNETYKELMAQWQAQADRDMPQKQIGSPMAAVAALGETLMAGLKKKMEAQGRDDVLMISQASRELPIEAVVDANTHLEAAQ